MYDKQDISANTHVYFRRESNQNHPLHCEKGESYNMEDIRRCLNHTVRVRSLPELLATINRKASKISDEDFKRNRVFPLLVSECNIVRSLVNILRFCIDTVVAASNIFVAKGKIKGGKYSLLCKLLKLYDYLSALVDLYVDAHDYPHNVDVDAHVRGPKSRAQKIRCCKKLHRKLRWGKLYGALCTIFSSLEKVNASQFEIDEGLKVLGRFICFVKPCMPSVQQLYVLSSESQCSMPLCISQACHRVENPIWLNLFISYFFPANTRIDPPIYLDITLLCEPCDSSNFFYIEIASIFGVTLKRRGSVKQYMRSLLHDQLNTHFIAEIVGRFIDVFLSVPASVHVYLFTLPECKFTLDSISEQKEEEEAACYSVSEEEEKAACHSKFEEEEEAACHNVSEEKGNACLSKFEEEENAFHSISQGGGKACRKRKICEEHYQGAFNRLIKRVRLCLKRKRESFTETCEDGLEEAQLENAVNKKTRRTEIVCAQAECYDCCKLPYSLDMLTRELTILSIY